MIQSVSKHRQEAEKIAPTKMKSMKSRAEHDYKEEPEHLEAIGLRRKAIDSPADLEASKRACVPRRVVLSHIPALLQ